MHAHSPGSADGIKVQLQGLLVPEVLTSGRTPEPWPGSAGGRLGAAVSIRLQSGLLGGRSSWAPGAVLRAAPPSSLQPQPHPWGPGLGVLCGAAPEEGWERPVLRQGQSTCWPGGTAGPPAAPAGGPRRCPGLPKGARCRPWAGSCLGPSSIAGRFFGSTWGVLRSPGEEGFPLGLSVVMVPYFLLRELGRRSGWTVQVTRVVTPSSPGRAMWGPCCPLSGRATPMVVVGLLRGRHDWELRAAREGCLPSCGGHLLMAPQVGTRP